MSVLAVLFLVIVGAATQGELDQVTSRVKCTTTKGDLLIDIYREWAPLGADRFIELVEDGFFQDIAFFRCVKRFLTQFGISDKKQYKHWHSKEIPDDPNLHKGIHKNYLSFAGGGPNTRSTQLFIAFEDLDFLGNEPWETPFGKVVEGQATLDALYKEYGDIPPFGKGPDQQKIHNRGNEYLRQNFPNVDYLLSCSIQPLEQVAQQTAFVPEAHSPDAEADVGAAMENKADAVMQQTPFDPSRTTEKDGPSNNLRPGSAVGANQEFKRYVLLAGLLVAGTFVGVMLAMYFKKRLVALAKSN